MRYELKTPYRNGTTHVIFEPLDFIARLSALIPKPKQDPLDGEEKTPMEQRSAMTWARRLKRVFSIDITECEKCKGSVRIIACLEDPVVIKKILKHLDDRERESHTQADLPPPGRAPPPLVQPFMFEQRMPNRTD